MERLPEKTPRTHQLIAALGLASALGTACNQDPQDDPRVMVDPIENSLQPEADLEEGGEESIEATEETSKTVAVDCDELKLGQQIRSVNSLNVDDFDAVGQEGLNRVCEEFRHKYKAPLYKVDYKEFPSTNTGPFQDLPDYESCAVRDMSEYRDKCPDDYYSEQSCDQLSEGIVSIRLGNKPGRTRMQLEDKCHELRLGHQDSKYEYHEDLQTIGKSSLIHLIRSCEIRDMTQFQKYCPEEAKASQDK